MTVTQFESLLKTHGSAILGFCRHLTGNEVSAQDLYQDTLLKAFSKLAKINCDMTEEMLSAKNYLIGIAVKLYDVISNRLLKFFLENEVSRPLLTHSMKTLSRSSMYKNVAMLPTGTLSLIFSLSLTFAPAVT